VLSAATSSTITAELVGLSGLESNIDAALPPGWPPAHHDNLPIRQLTIAAARHGASPRDHTELGRRFTTRTPRTRRNPREPIANTGGQFIALHPLTAKPLGSGKHPASISLEPLRA
jgi:hypothetical protein